MTKLKKIKCLKCKSPCVLIGSGGRGICLDCAKQELIKSGATKIEAERKIVEALAG